MTTREQELRAKIAAIQEEIERIDSQPVPRISEIREFLRATNPTPREIARRQQPPSEAPSSDGGGDVPVFIRRGSWISHGEEFREVGVVGEVAEVGGRVAPGG